MNKSERKAIGKVLRRAAERIVDKRQDYCCYAINNPKVERIFTGLFADSAIAMHYKSGYGTWFQEPIESCDMPEVRLRRSIGLLLCAEVVESGDWP